MNISAGIGKLDRERLAAILRSTPHTISVVEAAKVLNMPRPAVARLLVRWASKGWLSRIKRGLYIPVPLESVMTDISPEDPWIIAQKLYEPCYIGGWSAAEFWGLTDQIFRTIVVLSAQKLRARNQTLKGTRFLVSKVSEKALFGLKTIWRGQVKVSVSDPSRTILDMLVDPTLGAGLRSTLDIFIEYLESEHKNLKLLIDYAKQLGNGAVFKRLGFLLEQYAPEELLFIDECKTHLTKGKAKLDPEMICKKLITNWQLWIPERWEK